MWYYITTGRCSMERKGKRKSHSREFKLEAVSRSNDPTKTIAEVARELDIRENDLHEWRHQVSKKGENVFPGAGCRRNGSTNSDELIRLRKKRNSGDSYGIPGTATITK
jgi:transposase